MFFVIKWKEGPTVQESKAAADRAMGLLNLLGRTNISAQRCHSSLATLFDKKPCLGEKSLEISMMSPKSRFMYEIGAMDCGED